VPDDDHTAAPSITGRSRASQQNWPAHVRVGSLADFMPSLGHVRFAPRKRASIGAVGMSAWGQTRSFGDVGSMSGFAESRHGWAIHEYTPSVHTGRDRLSKKCESRFTLTDGESGSGHDATVARCVVTSPGPSLGSGGSGRSGRASVVPEAQAVFSRRRHQPSRPPLAKIRPGSPAPAMGLGTGAGSLARKPIGKILRKSALNSNVGASSLVAY
jgi:hypothetical protein